MILFDGLLEDMGQHLQSREFKVVFYLRLGERISRKDCSSRCMLSVLSVDIM